MRSCQDSLTFWGVPSRNAHDALVWGTFFARDQNLFTSTLRLSPLVVPGQRLLYSSVSRHRFAYQGICSKSYRSHRDRSRHHCPENRSRVKPLIARQCARLPVGLASRRTSLNSADNLIPAYFSGESVFSTLLCAPQLPADRHRQPQRQNLVAWLVYTEAQMWHHRKRGVLNLTPSSIAHLVAFVSFGTPPKFPLPAVCEHR